MSTRFPAAFSTTRSVAWRFPPAARLSAGLLAALMLAAPPPHTPPDP